MPNHPNYHSPPPEIPFRKDCTNCQIGKVKDNSNKCGAVGGAGPNDLSQVKLILISDHPGFYEERYGYPFVSKQEVQQEEYERGKRKKAPDAIRNAGELIRKMLYEMFGLDTYREVYSTNVLKCDPGPVTPQDTHLRSCTSWLTEEFEVLDRYVPEAPVLIAGTKALRALPYTFRSFRPQAKKGINSCRRRVDLKLNHHPAVFTFNPAAVARSEPRIETKAKPKSKLVKESDWLYPPLPGSPTDIMIGDLEFLDHFL